MNHYTVYSINTTRDFFMALLLFSGIIVSFFVILAIDRFISGKSFADSSAANNFIGILVAIISFSVTAYGATFIYFGTLTCDLTIGASDIIVKKGSAIKFQIPKNEVADIKCEIFSLYPRSNLVVYALYPKHLIKTTVMTGTRNNNYEFSIDANDTEKLFDRLRLNNYKHTRPDTEFIKRMNLLNYAVKIIIPTILFSLVLFSGYRLYRLRTGH